MTDHTDTLTAEHEELVRAWNAWEDRPGMLGEALRMEKACQVVADELGLTINDLRRALSAERREGHGPETSLRNVVDAHS